MDIVWSGPSSAHTPVRATVHVLTDLIARASRELILVTYPARPYPALTQALNTALGSRNNAGVFGHAVDLVDRDASRVRELVTHEFPIERTAEAMQFAMDNPMEAGKS